MAKMRQFGIRPLTSFSRAGQISTLYRGNLVIYPQESLKSPIFLLNLYASGPLFCTYFMPVIDTI